MSHSVPMMGHLAGEKLCKSLRIGGGGECNSDVMTHCMSCPQCATATTAGLVNKPVFIF